MIEGFFRAAVGTPEVRVADPDWNRERIAELCREAAEKGAGLLVLPELCLTGYTAGDLFLQSELQEGALRALSWLLSKTRELPLLIVLGLPLSFSGKLYNSAAVLYRGRVLGLVPKKNLPNYSEFYERRWFSPAEDEIFEYLYRDPLTKDCCSLPFGMRLLFQAEDLPDFCLALELCEDLWVPNPPSTEHAAAGAYLIANCSASDETVGKADYRRELLRSASARICAAYLYANAGEGESTQDLVFGGQSMIAENGSILAESRRFTTGLTISEIDLERIRQERTRLGTYPAPRAEGYRRIPFRFFEGGRPSFLSGSSFSGGSGEEGSLFRRIDPHPFVPSSGEERARRCEEILSIQALGLKKRLSHIGTKQAVLGISGGLDSTLALLVTARAFDLLKIPRENILSVTMPAFGTTKRTLDNARRLTEAIGATLREIDIRLSVEQHFRDIGHDAKKRDVVYENAQARERTQVLMDLSNACGGIVVGTGDLSELALGYATYNGDHMSMYAVNAGVLKTLVRHLVRYIADTEKRGALSETLLDILDTPVSPELLPPSGETISQKTEELVGPYELHDFFLYQILRFGFRPKKVYELALSAFHAGDSGTKPQYEREEILFWLKSFYRRFFSQQFKRSCLPDGPKVGSVSVSPRGDLRMPSDASAALWLSELEKL